MLNLLLASRKRPYCPGLSKPERICMDISGTVFEFYAPRHNDSGTPEDQPVISQFDLTDDRFFCDEEGTGFRNAALLSRHLDFFGAPFGLSSSVGTIHLLVTVDRVDCLPGGMTCLNEKHFEQAVMRLIYQMGPGTYFGETGPYNWCIQRVGGRPWVIYEMRTHLSEGEEPRSSYYYTQYTSCAIAQLDDKHLLRVTFNNLGSIPEKVSRKVRDDICHSFRIKYAPVVARKIEKQAQQYPEDTLSEYVGPAGWAKPVWRYGEASKGEPSIVYLKPSDPPPEFNF